MIQKILLTIVLISSAFPAFAGEMPCPANDYCVKVGLDAVTAFNWKPGSRTVTLSSEHAFNVKGDYECKNCEIYDSFLGIHGMSICNIRDVTIRNKSSAVGSFNVRLTETYILNKIDNKRIQVSGRREVLNGGHPTGANYKFNIPYESYSWEGGVQGKSCISGTNGGDFKQLELSYSREAIPHKNASNMVVPFEAGELTQDRLTVPQLNQVDRKVSGKELDFKIAQELDSGSARQMEYADNNYIFGLFEGEIREFLNVRMQTVQPTYWLNRRGTRLYMTMGPGEPPVVFEVDIPKGAVSSGEVILFNDLKTEMQMILLKLGEIKLYRRPDEYQTTYGQMEKSARQIIKLMNDGLPYNHARVKEQFQTIYFMYTKALKYDIDEDLKSTKITQAVSELVRHINHSNHNFYRFEELRSGVVHFATIASDIRETLGRMNQIFILRKEELNPEERELNKVIDRLWRLAQDIETRKAVGDADSNTGLKVDELLTNYDRDLSKIEKGVELYPAWGGLDGRLARGIEVMRNVRNK